MALVAHSSVLELPVCVPLMGDGFMGGLAPHFFVFDFFTNFHFDFSKDLLEVLRFFPLLNHGGKIFEKKFFRLAVT